MELHLPQFVLLAAINFFPCIVDYLEGVLTELGLGLPDLVNESTEPQICV